MGDDASAASPHAGHDWGVEKSDDATDDGV